MDSGYLYDVFLSYRRKPPIEPWIKNHFYPELKDWLDSTLPYESRIYFDQEQETGVNWPQNLKTALLRSRCVVTVWAPQYFRSKWCMAEWESIRKRQELLGFGTETNPRGLVFPVIFHDGKNFPIDASVIQSATSLKKYNYPAPVFKQAPDYLKFIKEMQNIADELSNMILSAPEWQPNWPVVMPEISDRPTSTFIGM